MSVRASNMTVRAETRYLDVEFKTSRDGGELSGYAAAWSLDNGGDRIIPGAFAKTIRERVAAGKVPLLDSHIWDAAHTIGTVVEAREDARGLFIRAKLASTPDAQAVRQKAREGHLSRMSIGYQPIQYEYERGDDGQLIRVLKEVKLLEASVVPLPMNEDATITGIKSDDNEREIAERLRMDVQTMRALYAEYTRDEEAQAKGQTFNEWLSEPCYRAPRADGASGRKAAGGVVVPRGISLEQAWRESAGEGGPSAEMKAFERFVRTGVKAAPGTPLSHGSEGEVVPEDFAAELIRARERFSVVRRLARPFTTDRDVLRVPKRTVKSQPSWTGEGEQIPQSPGEFDAILFQPYKLSHIVTLTSEWLEDQAFDVVGYLVGEAAELFGVAEETAFWTGTGDGEIQGIMHGGFPEIETAGAAITADDVIALYYSLPTPYRQNAAWFMSSTVAQVLRTAKAATSGAYIWTDLASGDATLLGRPVYIVEDLPSEVDPGTAQVVFFGDLRAGYGVCDRTRITMRRLEELYADYDSVGLLFRARVDGRVLNADAGRFLSIKAA